MLAQGPPNLDGGVPWRAALLPAWFG